MDREELLRRLWTIAGIGRPETRPTIRVELIERAEVVSQVKALVPYLRIHFPVAKHRCLVPSGWENAKKPVLNLLRQILRTIGYKCVPIPGTHGSYIVIPLHEKDPALEGTPRRSSQDPEGSGPRTRTSVKSLSVRHGVGLQFT